jgi:hypothetical protein
MEAINDKICITCSVRPCGTEPEVCNECPNLKGENTMLKEMADSVRNDAAAVLKDVKSWKEPEMKAMFRGDAADLRKVAKLIEQDKIKEAADHARHMDTAARENINDKAWDFLMAHGE